MSSSLETVPCKEHLPDVYRFAYLMTGSGDAAAEVLRRTVERAARGGIGDLRDPLRARRWLFAEARQHCGGPLPATPLPPVPGGETIPDSHLDVPSFPGTPPSDLPANADGERLPDAELALAFGAIPERERSALILFYLYVFNASDLADTLDLRPDSLGPILTRARALLQREFDKFAACPVDEMPAAS